MVSIFYEEQIFIFSPAASEFSITDSTWFISFFKRKKGPPTPPISRLVASLLSYKTTLLAERRNAQAGSECSPGKATSATVAGNAAVSLSSA